jgi:4'-phosphopantetheinyl transferase
LPLHRFFKRDRLHIGIWKIEETDDFFYRQMVLSDAEKDEVASLSPRKKTEWLASRYLLHITLNKEDRYSCLKDEHGKPYLEGSGIFISLTHSRDYVATVFSDVPCGIDMQYHVDKIGMIAKKFVTPEEKSFIPTDKEILYLHALWSTKEAVYKTYGKKGVSLVQDIQTEPFSMHEEGITEIKITLQKNDVIKKYKCEHEIQNGYTLVWSWEI